MQAILFNFSKRLNSTKRPIDEEGVTVTISIKQNVPKGQSSSQSGTETFLSHPTVWVQGDYTEYNYMKFKGRYYFIRDIQLTINNATVIYGEIDVLASYKDTILNTSAFVKYSSSDYSSLIMDDRVAPLIGCRSTYASEPSVFSETPALIITIIGKDGGVNNFYTGYATLANILTTLLNNTTSWWQSIFASLSDALSALVSVREVPIQSLPTAGGRDVYLGSYDLEIADVPVLSDINAGLLSDTAYITIPRTYADFRRSSRFTKLKLYLPFVGVVSLSSDDFLDSEGVSIATELNAMTGNVLYRIGNDHGILSTYSGTFGRQLPMSNIQLTNVGQSLGTIASGIVGAAGLSRMGGIGGVAASASLISSGLTAMMQFNQESVNMIGGYSGGYGELIGTNFYLLVEEQLTRIEPSELTDLYGRPCASVKRISDLTGYVETIGFSVSLPDIKEAVEKVNTMMDSGVYIE